MATCAIAQDVRYNFAWDTHFEKLKTYKWVELEGTDRTDEIKDKIKAPVDAKLTKKCLTKTDADTADLYVAYQIGLAAEKQLASHNPDWGYGPGWHREGWFVGHYGASEGQTTTIHAGQLAVDMYDSRNHYLVWRGVVGKAVEPTDKPDKQQKSLTKSVNKLIKTLSSR